jgi:phage-related protein
LQSGELAARRELTLAQISSTEGLAAAERELQERMQETSLDASKQAQIRDIASREGLAAAERALQQAMQQTEIGYQTGERALDRELQQTIAGWNLDSSDRNAAAQFLYQMETLYNSTVNAIMANTNLTKTDRENQLKAAKNLRDRQLDFTQQLYAVSLDWGQPAT